MQYNAKRDNSFIRYRTLPIATGFFSSIAFSGFLLIIMIETNSLPINPLYFSTIMEALTNI
ncbi:MAG: hypothetical protein ACRD5B_12305, partial [Nitrososphaeraceae archaeon]